MALKTITEEWVLSAQQLCRRVGTGDQPGGWFHWLCTTVLTNTWVWRCLRNVFLVGQRQETQFKMLWRENSWFLEEKFKNQSQEAGGNEYKPYNTLKIKELSDTLQVGKSSIRIVQLGLSNKGFSYSPRGVYENAITGCLVECGSACFGGWKSAFFGFSKRLRAQTLCLNPGFPNF